MSVIESYLQILNEKKDKKWIQKAIKKPGALHKALGVPEGEKIPASKLKVKKTDSPKMKKRKLLAKNLKKMHHEQDMEKSEKLADIITDTDAEINDYILKARSACRDNYKDKNDTKSRISFLICFEKTEAKGLEEGLKFLKENISDCGTDSYCNKLLAEEIKFTQERVDLIYNRIKYLEEKNSKL